MLRNKGLNIPILFDVSALSNIHIINYHSIHHTV